MVQVNYIVWPWEQASSQQIGGKAAALAALSQSTLQTMIPPWFALSQKAFSNSQKEDGDGFLSKVLRVQISKAVTILQQQVGENSLFAVRSSAIGEDSATSSYAGQLSSILNVPAQEIESAVLRVWASAQQGHITTYQTEMGQKTEALIPAVLIQAMAPARVSGVGFSADPVSGNHDQMIISACEGLGEKLVGGQVNGDTYYCQRDGSLIKQICENAPLLDADEVRQISQLLTQLESFFNTHQDVEWAYVGEKLWLLQSRPITTSGTPVGVKNNAFALPGKQAIAGTQKILWDNSNIVESYSGVTSPLTFSFACYVYENVYIEFCCFMGVGRKRVEQKQKLFRNMLGSINGHIYYNLLHWYEFLTLFPGFMLNRRFMEQMMGVGEELPDEFLKKLIPSNTSPLSKVMDILRLTRSGLGLLYNAIVLRRKVNVFNQRLNDALAIPVNVLLQMPLDAICSHYRDLEQKLLRHWDAPLINDFLCMMAFGLSRKLLKKYGGDAGLAYHRDMLIGQGDIISAEPAKRIRTMARAVSDKPELAAILSAGNRDTCWQALKETPEIEHMVKNYLDKFGDRCLQELKLESPTMSDEPGTLFSSIGYLASRLHDGETEAKNVTRLPALEAVIGPGWWRNKIVAYISQWTKNLVSGRENLRFERTRVFGRVRQIFVQIGRRLVSLQTLQDERDVFYLTVDEILGLIEGRATFPDIGALAQLRKREYARLRQLPSLPPRLITEGAVFAGIPESGDQKKPFSVEHVHMEGIACCQGNVRAPVRVITDPRQAKLKAGEIMVAQFTDPGWITLFANAAGILIERGSLLSHSAIVARELNIPAIVALTGIMQWLKTGDIVEMDGGTGRVRKVETS
jgi:pyruvate,water dikinase